MISRSMDSEVVDGEVEKMSCRRRLCPCASSRYGSPQRLAKTWPEIGEPQLLVMHCIVFGRKHGRVKRRNDRRILCLEKVWYGDVTAC